MIKFDASLGDKPELLQIVKKPEDDLQVIYEEAIMKVDNEVIVNEKITIVSFFLDETKHCLCIFYHDDYV